jgi:prophage regulatory protein
MLERIKPMNLINKRIAAARTTLHPASLMRLVRAGKFPKPVPLGQTRIAFVEAEVEAWIKARVDERDGAIVP